MSTLFRPALLPAALASLVLLALAAALLARVVRRSVWWHWSNENELAPGRKGSPLRHGRAWFHVRDGRRAGGTAFRVEWSLFRSSMLGFGFEVSDGDGPSWQVCLGIGFAAIYLTLTSSFLRWLVPRYPAGGRECRVSIHDGAIWIALWAREFEWRSRDPWWVRGVRFHPADVFLGEEVYEKREIYSTPALIPMPERPYRAVVTLFESSWKRPRWPFARRMIRADVTMDRGEQIPTPGKGENSWDCDEDATFSLTTPATTVPAAIAAMVESVLESRQRYGGAGWRPEAARPGRGARA